MADIVDLCRTVADGAGAAWDDAPAEFLDILKACSDTLTEAADEVERLRAFRRCHEELLVAYRFGRRPSGKCLDELAALRAAEAKGD